MARSVAVYFYFDNCQQTKDAHSIGRYDQFEKLSVVCYRL
jgi:hypothetical protein